MASGLNVRPCAIRRLAGAKCESFSVRRHLRIGSRKATPLGRPAVSVDSSAGPHLAAGAIVQRIFAAGWQAARHLVYDRNDLPHDIAAVGSGDTFEEVADRRPDLRLGIVFAVEMNSSDMTVPFANSSRAFVCPNACPSERFRICSVGRPHHRK